MSAGMVLDATEAQNELWMAVTPYAPNERELSDENYSKFAKL